MITKWLNWVRFSEQKDDSCGGGGGGGMKWVGMRFHHATHNGTQFKTYEFPFFWNFPFNILGSWLDTGNKPQSKTVDKEGYWVVKQTKVMDY